jgi:hypothetical protein
MKAHRKWKIVFALLPIVANMESLRAQSRIDFVRNSVGPAIRLEMHSLREAVFPDNLIEASDDLNEWRPVLHVPGGVNVWPVTRDFAWNINERKQFFRLREHLNVVGANLNGVDLSGQNLRGANLPWAQMDNALLAGTDLSEANLHDAKLRGATLTGARLVGANLCNADLGGAKATTNDLAGAALLNTRLPDQTFATDDFLAEALALDFSAELTAPESLYVRLRRELAAIRRVMPEAVPRVALFEWGIPNGIYVSVTEQQYAALNTSELGPVHYLPNQPSRIGFARHFHPRALAVVLRTRFGISQIEPFLFGDGDHAKVEFTDSASKYTFDRGFGDCPAGCIERRITMVQVTNLNGQIVVQRL